MKPVSHHTLLVPNTWLGKLFLLWFRLYLNRDTYRLRYRGRGPRASVARANGQYARNFDQDLPRRHARYVAIYLDVKDSARARIRAARERQMERARTYAREHGTSQFLPDDRGNLALNA